MKNIPLKLLTLSSLLLLSCGGRNSGPAREAIDDIHLKTGELISCGPANKEFGSVVFETSCTGEKEQFNLGMELLHSFEYDEAEKAFAKIIDKNPSCAMAYWGVAMSNFHPLWSPPTEPELKKGEKALDIARTIAHVSKREQGYIEAISAYYGDYDKADHHTRCLRFEKGMEKLYKSYPDDREATIFYTLGLTAAADPADKTLSKQKQAGALLMQLYQKEPNHPGIIHYIIHTYDYPELATLALPAARKYAAVAPSSAHALHMPSHIFTRLGLWDECIHSNLVSISSAKCYAQQAGIKGHWDEELHGLDYLVYAYLQKGEDRHAKEQWDYLNTMDVVYPSNAKVAYAYAAIPSRYLLETRDWKGAAHLSLYPASFSWKNYPWQEAIVHFTRSLGFVHTGRLDSAGVELAAMKGIYERLQQEKDNYKAGQVLIQIRASEAWIELEKGRKKEALDLMRLAADMEDKTEKHPVTPCEVIPARELLGDMLVQVSQPTEALSAYEDDLQKHPNRWNALYGAVVAARGSGLKEKARQYARQLLNITDSTNSDRPMLVQVRKTLL